MKITTTKQSLNKALFAACRFCNNKTRTGIHDTINLSLAGKNLCVFGTDVDTELGYYVNDVKVHRRSKMDICVSGSAVKDAIKTLKSNQSVTLQIVRHKKAKKGERKEKDYLHVTTHVLDLKIYEHRNKQLPLRHPMQESLGSKFSFGMPAEEMRDLLQKTCGIIPDDFHRYYINGLFFHRENRGNKKYMRVVVTDGHRLGIVEKPLPAGMGKLPVCNLLKEGKTKASQRRAEKRRKETKYTIIPRKAVLEMQRLIGSKDKCKIYVNFGENIVRLHWHDEHKSIIIQSCYLDGTYPDYKKVLPKQKHWMEVDDLALDDAFDSMKDVKKKTIRFHITKETLRVQIKFSDFGESIGEMTQDITIAPSKSMKKLDPDPMVIGLNKDYVQSYVDACDDNFGGSHKIGFTDHDNPVSFERDESYYFLLMPMRI